MAEAAEMTAAELREEQWNQTKMIPVHLVRWMAWALLTLVVRSYELTVELLQAFSFGLKTSGWVMGSTFLCILTIGCRALCMAANQIYRENITMKTSFMEWTNGLLLMVGVNPNTAEHMAPIVGSMAHQMARWVAPSYITPFTHQVSWLWSDPSESLFPFSSQDFVATIGIQGFAPENISYNITEDWTSEVPFHGPNLLENPTWFGSVGDCVMVVFATVGVARTFLAV